ncbi:MAG: glycosyltransferase family 9 protein [Elusimicrobia bacterium]|nr:glycosyltransferase family 9 protein [Elusimicrobiota bacterium]
MKALRCASSLAATLALRLCRNLRRGPAPAEPRRVLVLGYAAIGDLIFFQPVLEGLRRQYPMARIVFLANPYPTTREYLPATGLVDEIWLWEWEGAGSPSDARPILDRIRAARFDLAVLTLSSPLHYFQSALRDVPVLAGHCRKSRLSVRGWPALAKRWLVTGEFARRALLDRRADIEPAGVHAVERNLRLLDALGVPRPPQDRPRIPLSAGCRAFADRVVAGLDPSRRRIALHLGSTAGQYGKIWPAARFAAVCRALADELPAEILAVGSADEAPGVEEVRRLVPGLRSCVGQTRLLETFALIARCDLFLGNDTGLAKAAMAMGVPTVTVLGLSDPAEIGIYWDPEKHLEVRAGLPCSPCARLGMAVAEPGRADYSNCGRRDCLDRIDAAAVLSAIRGRYPALFRAPS